MTKKQEARIRSLRKAGKSIKAIAKELHICDKRVGKFLKPVKANNKIEIPKKAVTKKEVAMKAPWDNIRLTWKNGRIVESSIGATELLAFAHHLIAFATDEILSKK